MKTLHTSRGIAFYAEISFTGTKSITVEITCEEGSKNFDFEYPYELDNAMLTAIDEEDFDYLIDDFTEIYNFVDSSVIGEISRQAAELCVELTNTEYYYAFSINCINSVAIYIYKHTMQDGFAKKINESWDAIGTEEINELLKKLRNV
ncbi:MAG: hypothetical protein [Caudoviricetes sp.]|nr:MAG: hypothetical protein [Caudoviricetes sp.]